MKKVLAILAMVLMFCGSAQAATLQWDHAGADGFIMYYTDQTNNYNYNVVGDVREVDLDILQVTPGVEYTYYVTAYNSSGESGPSNTVTHTVGVFSPPVNVLPVASPVPGNPEVLRIL